MANLLKLGVVSPDVLAWQQTLSAAGFLTPETGTFDAATDTATQAYQGVLGVTADGMVGPETLAAVKVLNPTAAIFQVPVTPPRSPSYGFLALAAAGLAYIAYVAWKER